MAFPPRFLDEIRNRLSLAEAIGRRVKLIRRGREFVGLCPFHHEKSPSFTVVEEKNFYHCFGCGAHGDVIGFTMRTEGLPFPEAVEKLAAEAGLALPERDPRAEEHARIAKTLYDANEAAAEWFAAQLYTPEGRTALDYLKRRGLEDRTIARFRLGYAPDARDAIKRALVPKGYAEAQLLEAGLLIKPDDGRSPYDRFRGRVMFPISDKRGRVIAFGGRVLGDEKPKYLNSPDTPLFHKGRVLYAYREARTAAQGGSEILVAEGYMDVIALHQAGFEGAVAPLGTALTEAQIEELWRVQPEPLLCFDGDEAGRRAAARAAERVLPILKPGKSLRFVFLPEGDDPDSLIREGGPEAMKSVLAQAVPLVHWLWRIETDGRPIDTPERRSLLRSSVLKRVAEIADGTIQEHYASDYKQRLNDLFFPKKSEVYARVRRRGPGPQLARPGDRPHLQVKVDGNTNKALLQAHKALLAAVIRHPELLHALAEDLVRIDLKPGGELDRLRDALLKTAAVPLDSAATENHLNELGFSDVLRSVLSHQVSDVFRIARVGTSHDETLRGWQSLFREIVVAPELERERLVAERRLAEDTTKRNLTALNAVKSQTAAARGAANATALESPAQDGGTENGLRRDREGS